MEHERLVALGEHIATYGANNINMVMAILGPVCKTLKEPKSGRNDIATNSQSSETKHQCSSCGADATTSCAGCTNVVCLPSSTKTWTYYCSKDCQGKDWLNHKETCKLLKNEIDQQSFINAAQFLLDVFYVFRFTSFDLSVKSVEWVGDDLVVHEGKYEEGARVVDAPFDLMKSFDKETNTLLLSLMACDDTQGHMHHLIKMIMLGEYHAYV